VKKQSIIFVALTAISAILAACSTSGINARSQAHLLEQGMPEAEVASLIGNPNKISVRTCGSDTDNPWTCKVHEYTSYFFPDEEKTDFTVYYYQLYGNWYLNHFITH